jgi:hypothetical protein
MHLSHVGTVGEIGIEWEGTWVLMENAFGIKGNNVGSFNFNPLSKLNAYIIKYIGVEGRVAFLTTPLVITLSSK